MQMNVYMVLKLPRNSACAMYGNVDYNDEDSNLSGKAIKLGKLSISLSTYNSFRRFYFQIHIFFYCCFCQNQASTMKK